MKQTVMKVWTGNPIFAIYAFDKASKWDGDPCSCLNNIIIILLVIILLIIILVIDIAAAGEVWIWKVLWSPVIMWAMIQHKSLCKKFTCHHKDTIIIIIGIIIIIVVIIIVIIIIIIIIIMMAMVIHLLILWLSAHPAFHTGHLQPSISSSSSSSSSSLPWWSS